MAVIVFILTFNLSEPRIMNQNQASTIVSADAADSRKIYLVPTLKCLGDVRDLTLGGSVGTGDSGDPNTQQF